MKARAVQWDAWRGRIAPLGLLAATFWFYLWTVSQGLPLRSVTTDGHYLLLTDAFIAGQLSLPITPHPNLLKGNPYDDFGKRPPYLHDASLYEGKYYVYFGVTPVVLLFLPFRVLGLGNLPENAAVAVFTFGSVLFSLLTLAFLRHTEFPSIRKLPSEIYPMLALGGAIPYFLRRPAVYEVAIACGLFCVTVAIYLLVTLESKGKISLVRAALASLFLGLAVGARPHLLMASPLLVFGAWQVLRREKRWPSPAEIAALVLPILLVGVALGWYNYARFDSWTEFGRWYQLAGEPVRHLHFDVRRVPFFSYLYLFHPGRVNLAFPYVHVRPADLPDLGGVIVEPVTGLLYSTPILYVLAVLPLLRSWHRDDSETTQPVARSAHIWAWVFVALALAQLLFVATFPGATMRYLVDFSPLLMMAAAIVMMALAVRLHGSRWRLPVRSAMVLLVGVTVFLNARTGDPRLLRQSAGGEPCGLRAAQEPVRPDRRCDRSVFLPEDPAAPLGHRARRGRARSGRSLVLDWRQRRRVRALRAARWVRAIPHHPLSSSECEKPHRRAPHDRVEERREHHGRDARRTNGVLRAAGAAGPQPLCIPPWRPDRASSTESIARGALRREGLEIVENQTVAALVVRPLEWQPMHIVVVQRALDTNDTCLQEGWPWPEHSSARRLPGPPGRRPWNPACRSRSRGTSWSSIAC